MNKPLVVNSANFRQEVILSEIPVILYVYAEYSAPSMTPQYLIINEIDEGLSSKVKICELNLKRDTSNLLKELNITSLPTTLFYLNGDCVCRVIGTISRYEFLKKLKTHLGIDINNENEKMFEDEQNLDTVVPENLDEDLLLPITDNNSNFSSTKICKYCKSDIPDDANICKYCRKQVSMDPSELFIRIILVIIVAATAGYLLGGPIVGPMTVGRGVTELGYDKTQVLSIGTAAGVGAGALVGGVVAGLPGAIVGGISGGVGGSISSDQVHEKEYLKAKKILRDFHNSL